MSTARTKIIKIGNSQGVRIPRHLLKEAGLTAGEQGSALGQEVELQIEQGSILVRPVRQARAGWAEQFARLAAQGDDALLADVAQTSAWDDHEWVW